MTHIQFLERRNFWLIFKTHHLMEFHYAHGGWVHHECAHARHQVQTQFSVTNKQ